MSLEFIAMIGTDDDAATDYIIKPAAHARGMMAVHCPSRDGWKTRAARLAECLARGRYSNRERAYLMSQAAARRFEKLFRDGWDANVYSRPRQLTPPQPEDLYS